MLSQNEAGFSFVCASVYDAKPIGFECFYQSREGHENFDKEFGISHRTLSSCERSLKKWMLHRETH
jgi:hypothetical protein